jgi:septal ring factor EnvC (AmiA/AmiB activator)
MVAFIGRVSGFGKTMVVDHGDHYYSVYSFLSEALVNQGERLKEQQLIAKSGESWAQGSGMYFEIRHFSDAVDPNDWFSKNKIRGSY